MKIAITGGSGFVGRHLAGRYPDDEVVAISRRTGFDIDDVDGLTVAFQGCDVVAHCAGINRELPDEGQTYERIHVQGAVAVVEAAKRAGVKKILLLSFLRARPDCGSPYHESKWAAEELIRASGLDYTILKAGMIYGHGDHLADHLSHTVQTIPVFGTVGLREKPIRPIPVAELVDVLVAAAGGRMPRETVVVTGAEELLLSKAVRRVAAVLGRRVLVVPLPVWGIRMLAWVWERTMTVPLVARSQARMLAEGVSEPWGPVTELPADLAPRIPFDEASIRAALPAPGGFGRRDLRCARRSAVEYRKRRGLLAE
ncbi:NAD-dependent epimerase/dehydratase family protein [Herbiconiux sp. P17]|uniref:NAD-dependent epimerase/dehydratase family protein n=1 Tax=Herbiconiux wuyangfengii TaxID=3342794 RepID=UPI0035BA2C87